MDDYRLILMVAMLMLPLIIVAEKKLVYAFNNYKRRCRQLHHASIWDVDCYDGETACHVAEEEVEVKDAETGMVYDDFEYEQL